ncbi:18250_t:CDS:10 [Acaulospora morrowiae]|uniref:18250_t:CDS:1 n=1 Tax=Acaulospora morrowiae TaxID=94023 RepID=A0A9N8Z5V1_9GLOM|nr:18250_t:CDS:10 [Acaulospora morrowiae]
MVRVTRSQYAKETQVLPVASNAQENEPGPSPVVGRPRGRSAKAEKSKVNEQASTDRYLDVWNTIKKHKDKRGRRIARLFTSLPDRKRYPDYYEEIKRPISLEIIKKKIERNDYQDEGELKADLELMFENAKRYNVEGSQIYNDAVELQILSRQMLGNPDDVFKVEVATPSFMNEIEHKGEIYRIGEYVHIVNERNPSKPNVGLIFNIWKEQNKGFVKICWYYRAEQTKHQASKKFYKDEVFKTNTFQDHPIEDIIEKCYVLPIKDYVSGRPKNSEGKMIYVCESRYTEHGNTFSKIRNWLGCLPRDSPVIKIELDRFESPLVLKKIGSPLTAAAQANEEDEYESRHSTMSDVEPEEPEMDSAQTSEAESSYSSPTGKRSHNKTASNRLSSIRTRSSRRQQPSYNSNNPADTVATASPRTQHPHHYSPYPAIHPSYQMANMNPMMYGGFQDSGIPPHYGYSYPIPYQHPQSHMMMSPQYSHPQNYPVMTPPPPPVQPHMNQMPMHPDDSLSNPIRQQTPGISKEKNPSIELPLKTAEHFVRDENGKVLWFVTPPIDVTPLPQPMHSIEYLHRYDEIQARNKLRMQEISGCENQKKNGAKNQDALKLNSVQESELIDTVKEISNGWKGDAIALKARLEDRS